jgi:hypothetical protein
VQRFLPLFPEDSPAEAPHHLCPHMKLADKVPADRLALGATKIKTIRATTVWALTPRTNTPAFTMCWTYGHKIICMIGSLADHEGVLTFSFQIPLQSRPLADILADDPKVGRDTKSLRLYHRSAKFVDSMRHSIVSAAYSYTDVKASKISRKPGGGAEPSAEPAAAIPVVEVEEILGEDDDEIVDIEGPLEELIGEWEDHLADIAAPELEPEAEAEENDEAADPISQATAV